MEVLYGSQLLQQLLLVWRFLVAGPGSFIGAVAELEPGVGVIGEIGSQAFFHDTFLACRVLNRESDVDAAGKDAVYPIRAVEITRQRRSYVGGISFGGIDPLALYPAPRPQAGEGNVAVTSVS